MRKSGGHPAGPELQGEIQVQPINVNLEGCQFMVGKRPDGVTVLQFVHLSGALAFTASLTPEAVQELIRQLTSGIVVPKVAPK